ncbi:hypothetical protein BN1708_015188 [Verticillium longisporum]|uniref:Uncharacterized protein n=1 Tax=Verticillium longisporum TaxID=100787 RepID=A0A0G4M395_VERLO|nr:hypothetical protein BN1708_015188 [Verticillium longisporum]
MAIKSHISSPLEAGPSILDVQHLPPNLTEALEYASHRLTRKGIHTTLIVLRRDYQLPLASADGPSPWSPTHARTASAPLRMPSFATSPMVASFKKLVRTGSATAASRADTPRLRWPLTPATPATPLTASSAGTDAGHGPMAANAFGLRLVLAHVLTDREERVLRQTIERAENKFRIGTEWLSPATDAASSGLAAPLIRRSLAQNEVLFASDGLTLVSLDRLYTFKAALASFARTGSPLRLEDAVDELRRLVLARCRHDSGTVTNAQKQIREHDPAYYGPEAPPADDEILVQNSAIDGALILFRKIFENFHCNLRSWNECFHLILRFAELGDAETAALLHDDWLKDLMFIIAADANYPGLPEHYVMLVRGLSRRMSNKPPSYDVIIQLINHLMKALEPLVQDDMVEEANERLALYLEDPPQPLPWTSEEVNVLFAEDRDYGGSFFVRRLLEIGQERQDTCAIIRRLAKGDEHMQKCVTRVLGNMISGKAEMHSMVPFLRAALTFVTHCNEPDTSQQVLQHVTQACRVLENNEGKSFLDFFQLAMEALVCMPLAEAKPGLMMHLELVPLWGPGLIGCVDKRSASLAQQWIEGFLVRHETQWAHEDAELHDRVVQAARQLGVGCLQYLQEQYVLAERQVVGSTIEPLHKMIVASEAYFEIDIDGGVSREGFHNLKEGKSKTWILESVERLLIEELDEDGSDWEDSSSDQMKSMTDVQLRPLSG